MIRSLFRLSFLSLSLPCLSLLVTLLPPTSQLFAADSPTREQLQFFEQHVRPVFATRCYKCHGSAKQKGQLRLDSRESILLGGDSGPAIRPGEPGRSLLMEAIRHESFEMPPKEKLPDQQIAAIERWVKMGAPWPDDSQIDPARQRAARIRDEDRRFWSFQPVRDVVPPEVETDWGKNEIDRFIWRGLKRQQLTPAEPASRRALIRRAWFDLTGLPPTPAAVDEFVADDSPQAWPRMIDRLLESPRYGEHWARHWLDLVRYAESDGYKQDAFRPHAWRYRDYVIRSFNDDKPYDQFVMEQLAGDEIDPFNPDVLVGTGFLRLWIYEYNQRDARTQWDTILNDVTDVTADVFLGMGMSCARCHDHKFDPILQDDYFRLRAFFAPMLPRDDVPLATAEQWARYSGQLAKWEEKTADLRRQINEIARPFRERAANGAIDKFPKDIRPLLRKPEADRAPLEKQLADFVRRQVEGSYDSLDIGSKLKGDQKKRWEELQQQLAELDSLKPRPLTQVNTVSDVGPVAPPTHVPGDPNRRDILPGFLTVLSPDDAQVTRPSSVESTGRRTALARWIASPDNPLSTRVIVNRVWQHHFGRGLVATPSDFGNLGEPPSHPELLDWLTRQFTDNGWRLKHLHRLIMNSATYQQTALREASPVAQRIDPDNRLLWRMNVKRLGAEQIRDAMLHVSGELTAAGGGPSVEATQPRRTIFTKVVRNKRDPLLDVFDIVDGFSSTSERNVTTTPNQSLLMINGPWVLSRAGAWARRIAAAAKSDEERVNVAYQQAFGRSPDADEWLLAREFMSGRRQAELADATAPADPLPTAGIQGRDGLAAVFKPASHRRLCRIRNNESLPDEDFTIEAVIQLRSLYPDAAVRTIAAHWNSSTSSAGWSFGVTSAKSRYQPRNLILQLIGKQGYEVVASNLRPELNKPYYVAASVRIAETGPAGVTFYMQDLSDKNAALQTAQASHRVTAGYRSQVAFTIGGRDTSNSHLWDGLLDDVRLSNAALSADQLLLNGVRPADQVAGFWQFEKSTGLLQDASGRGNDAVVVGAGSSSSALGQTPADKALVDFCHILLNSNEFIYTD